MKKERLDKVMVGRGLAPTREKAQALIMAGLVSSGGARLDKPGRLVPPDLPLDVERTAPFVSRAGLKLAEALDAFGIETTGVVCLDVGASTGGFTDCLLQRGAARVYAVDVDVRQIDARLRDDPRVTLVEKNARFLEPADLGGAGATGAAGGPGAPGGPDGPGVDLIVMDVSFISILKVLPALRFFFRPDGRTTLLSLVKPQFEAGRGQVGRKGIVRDPALHAEILDRVAREAAALGYVLGGLIRCSTRGRQGNQEFFARWTRAGLHPSAEAVLEWIRSATSGEP